VEQCCARVSAAVQHVQRRGGGVQNGHRRWEGTWRHERIGDTAHEGEERECRRAMGSASVCECGDACGGDAGASECASECGSE
jgi:hypothetical protein